MRKTTQKQIEKMTKGQAEEKLNKIDQNDYENIFDYVMDVVELKDKTK